MKCICGGWVRAGLVGPKDAQVVGLVCNGPCGYSKPIPAGKKAQQAVIEHLDANRVAMGRVW